MSKIKKRRLEELRLASHPELHVGDCVPFYFGTRSVMLYLLYRGDHPELDYNGGQEPIIHLFSDMHKTIRWAVENNLKYAFTTSNAGSEYFRDYTNKADLDKINWNAVNTNNWQNCREEKQAEFLIEKCFPWNLIEFIGVYSDIQLQQLSQILDNTEHQPQIAVKREWYY